MKIYREDGWKAEVEVLKDDSDEKFKRYTLKVLRTLRDSPLCKTPPDGEVFNVMQTKGCAYGGMWTLRDS